MKKTWSGWLAPTALATALGVAGPACANNVSGQLSQGSQGTFDTPVIGNPRIAPHVGPGPVGAQRIFCAQLHNFEQDTRQAADGNVLESDIEALASDAQSTPWSGVMQVAIIHFQSGHPALGYKVLATLDPYCQYFQ
jgi:hypothetical protein